MRFITYSRTKARAKPDAIKSVLKKLTGQIKFQSLESLTPKEALHPDRIFDDKLTLKRLQHSSYLFSILCSFLA